MTALALPAAANAQQAVFPPGSGVGLVPPKGLTLSKNFSGFESSALGASILTVDLPLPAFTEILTGFTPEGLAASGLQASGPSVDWKIAGGDGRLIRGKQLARGVTYRKWVVLARGRTATAMVTVQTPQTSAAELSDAAVEAALKTIALRDPPGIEEQVAGLPFRIGDRAGFRAVRALSGAGLVLTEGPQDTLRDASQPVVVVASSLGGGVVDPAGRAALAREGFVSVSGVDDLSVDNETAYDLGGAPWARIEGRGTYRASGEAVYVTQLVRYAPNGYIRIVAICRSLDKGRFADRFKRVADSVAAR